MLLFSKTDQKSKYLFHILFECWTEKLRVRNYVNFIHSSNTKKHFSVLPAFIAIVEMNHINERFIRWQWNQTRCDKTRNPSWWKTREMKWRIQYFPGLYWSIQTGCDVIAKILENMVRKFTKLCALHIIMTILPFVRGVCK